MPATAGKAAPPQLLVAENAGAKWRLVTRVLGLPHAAVRGTATRRVP